MAGGGSGIGAAIADAFREEEAEVVVTGVTEAEVEAASARGFRAVRDGGAVAALVGGFSRLDHVVNCAGVIRRGDELDPAVFAEVVDVNLTGSMQLCAAARPLLARARDDHEHLLDAVSAADSCRATPHRRAASRR